MQIAQGRHWGQYLVLSCLFPFCFFFEFFITSPSVSIHFCVYRFSWTYFFRRPPRNHVDKPNGTRQAELHRIPATASKNCAAIALSHPWLQNLSLRPATQNHGSARFERAEQPHVWIRHAFHHTFRSDAKNAQKSSDAHDLR